MRTIFVLWNYLRGLQSMLEGNRMTEDDEVKAVSKIGNCGLEI